MPGCLGSRAQSLLPPPSGEAPDASVLLQVTMADRAAAERACKDPNPNIDGRKANVNLAYLGAKPRSLQTGESACFPSLCFWLLYSASVSVGWKRPAPPAPRPAPGVAVGCHVLQESRHRAVIPQLGSRTPSSGCVCRWDRARRAGHPLVSCPHRREEVGPRAGARESASPAAAVPQLRGPPLAGSSGVQVEVSGRGEEAVYPFGLEVESCGGLPWVRLGPSLIGLSF